MNDTYYTARQNKDQPKNNPLRRRLFPKLHSFSNYTYLGGPSLCLSFYVDGAYFVLIGVAVSAWLEFDAGFDDFAAKFDHVLDILYVRFGCYCGSAC